MRSSSRWEKKRNDLVKGLKREGLIKSCSVEKAMLAVPRELFVSGVNKYGSYWDRPLPIGQGQTISAPHMVAIMAEALETGPGHHVLEIGGGSGYHAAVVSRMILPSGHLFSVERVNELVVFARRNLSQAGIKNVTIIEGDGSVGHKDGAPYDRIYYTCAAPKIPDMVLGQLAEGGILLGVVGPKNGVQRLMRYKAQGGRIISDPLTECVFVPLIGELGY